MSNFENNFNQYCCTQLDDFIARYQQYYEERVVNKVRATDQAVAKLDIITRAAKRLRLRLYLIIDEYDNFTNDILANYGHETFEILTHTKSFYKNFFKHFKGTFERIFIIGVLPISLDDLSSGYNINWNISNSPQFNSMLGFDEKEVRQILQYYKDQDTFHGDMESVIPAMKPWFDNYCFALKSFGKETVYNCDMALYYLKTLIDTGFPNEEFVDINKATDSSKLQLLLNLDKGLKREERISTLEEIMEKIMLICI